MGCGDHTVNRMLEEADDLNQFYSFGDPKLVGRAGSFCMERSGYNEAGLNDQGISFFLPNMTWLQPPGYVHAMNSETWLPNAINHTTVCSGSHAHFWDLGISTQASADGKT